jgi:hypothetical protein
MFRLCIRNITRAALPHPWFDLEHPLLKADPELMKMLRIMEKRGIKKKEEFRDMALEEHNTEDVQLFEVSLDVYEKNPELVKTLEKVYANYNPLKVIQNAAELPGYNFDKRIQQLPFFECNYTYQEMNDAKEIDYRYMISRFAPPKFRRLVDLYLEKVPICGMTVPLEDFEGFSQLNSAFDKEFYTFLLGEGPFLDEEERHVYRRFLIKQLNFGEFLDNRDIPFINESEDNFMIGMINFPGTDDHEYRCFYRPYFREYDVNKEMWTRNQNKWIIRISKFIWFWNYHR